MLNGAHVLLLCLEDGAVGGEVGCQGVDCRVQGVVALPFRCDVSFTNGEGQKRPCNVLEA